MTSCEVFGLVLYERRMSSYVNYVNKIYIKEKINLFTTIYLIIIRLRNDEFVSLLSQKK